MQLEGYRYIAHRGLHSKELSIFENTLEAFENAVKMGYAIELDVQLTKDGKIVVFHDYNLSRMTGKDILLKDITIDELKKITLKNSFSNIPTLEQVLKIVNGKVPLLIEVKNEGKVGLLEKSLKDILNSYNGKFMIESFNPFVVKYFKRNTKFLCGILTCKSYSTFKMKILGAIINIYISFNLRRFDFIAYKLQDLDNGFVLKCNKYNIPLILWTIGNEGDYKKALEFSDNIIFENILPGDKNKS